MDYLIGVLIFLGIFMIGIPLLTFGVMAIQCHKAGKGEKPDPYRHIKDKEN